MANVKYNEFKLELVKCFKECKEAVKQVVDTYNKAEDGIKIMSSEEEKAFLKEALLDIYKEADNKWEFQPLIDAGVESIAIPYGVEAIYKLKEKI